MLRTVEVSAHLQGTREELYGILADYDRYSVWMPGIELSSVLAREGDVTTDGETLNWIVFLDCA